MFNFKLPKWDVEYFTTPEAYNSFEPDWNIELLLARVPIDQFAAMTMGMDENKIVNLSDKGKLAVEGDLSNRLRVLMNNLDAGAFHSYKSDSTWMCSLKQVTQWAHDNGWELPEPLLKLIIKIPKQETGNPAQPTIPQYTTPWLDEKMSNYPPELDVALKAWRAVSATEGKGKPKARIKAWLDKNTELSNEAKERIAKVANWDKTGGNTHRLK